MTIRIVSFGYGHAAPPVAEAIYDLRRLFRNPFADPALKDLTGLDAAVFEHVLATPGVESLAQVVTFLAIGLHDTARGEDVTIAYGCVGGRHRGVDRTKES